MHPLITFGAKYLVFLMVLLPAYVWLRLNRDSKKRFILVAILASVIALVLAKIGSHLVASPRPFNADHVVALVSSSRDNGFPSDHTLMAGVLAFLTLKYNRLYGIIALILAVCVGWARVVAGVHHGIDILGSLVFAAIGVYAAAYLLDRFVKRPTTQP